MDRMPFSRYTRACGRGQSRKQYCVATNAAHSLREECEVRNGRRLVIEFQGLGERFAGILLLPDRPAPVPGALLLHGFTLDKERMSAVAGSALLGCGVASLALDLPLHGERFGGVKLAALGAPFELLRRWRGALGECALALEHLAARREIDPGRVGLVGYYRGASIMRFPMPLHRHRKIKVNVSRL